MIVGQSESNHDNRYDQKLNFTQYFNIDKVQNCLNFLWNLMEFHVSLIAFKMKYSTSS